MRELIQGLDHAAPGGRRWRGRAWPRLVLPRLARTSSFRLTFVYAALFSASVLVLFAMIYWAASFYMTRQIDAAVDSDVTELEAGLAAGGNAGVAAFIISRVAQMPTGPMLYLLEDRGGHVLAGNLPALPFRTGVFDFDLRAPLHRQGRRVIRAHGLILPTGAYLLVGADAQPLEAMLALIRRGFILSGAFTLVLAFGGGMLVSTGLLRRVETISRTAREIMEGNLSRRIPLRGVDDEFDHLAESLNAMMERTESSIEAMRQVSNDIAHELRTPLTRLRQRLELAQRRSVSIEDLRVALDRSIEDTDAILETFGALLRIAQIESGAAKARFAPIALDDVLHTVVEVYQPMAEDKLQRLEAHIEPALAVRGDRELLTQMFANLVENAIRHSPPRTQIGVAAHRKGDHVEVVVSDTGPGIPAADHAKVFRRFYRLDASRTTPGNGLGLSLVAAVATLHDIGIMLEDNRPGLRASLRFAS